MFQSVCTKGIELHLYDCITFTQIIWRYHDKKRCCTKFCTKVLY